jgi:hypothetical protein
MLPNFGRLIFLSSIAAMTGGVISTAYASSKAAVVGMMPHDVKAKLDELTHAWRAVDADR